MTISPDLALLDTNMLVYADQEEDEHHQAARALRDRGLRGEVALCVSPQVLYEYLAVVTSSRRVTQPRSPAAAMAEVEKYIRSRNIRKIFPGPGIHNRVRDLFRVHPISGPRIFDLYLIATMLDNGVTKIYTFNDRHFTPFSEIQVLTPPQPQPSA